MKKVTTLFSAVLFALFGFVSVQAQDALIISEYIEGSSNNKALEIYNTTDAEVSLENYQIAQASNGGGWEYFDGFADGATIASEGTYVLLNSETDPSLFAEEDADEVLSWPSPLGFNGNDARALIYINPTSEDTTILDVFGDPDSDAYWDVAGVTEGTSDHTLIRKFSVTEGNTTALGSFGSNEDDSEWVVRDQDDFSNLGTHGELSEPEPVDPSPAVELIFSEYIEGSSNNKAIEIFNTTGEDVSLEHYQIAQASNGGGWQYFDGFADSAVIGATATYVLLNDGTDPSLFAPEDADEVLSWPSPLGFNGNDARALIHIEPASGDTTILDVFGDPNSDAYWDVAGETEATAEHTLIRKANVSTGNTTALGSFGTSVEDSEWIVRDQDDFSDLGSHTFGFEVTFQADLSDMIDSAAFVPGEDFITIPGSMNDWSTSADTLTDADEDGIYTKTLTLAPSDQSYKFHIYSNTGRISGGYEANQETDNTNRNFTVDSDTTLDAEQPDFEFRDLNDAVFGEVELYFQVDMSIQELNGNFDPASDEYVSVTGAFEQDWSATAYPLTETQEDGIYEGTVTFSTEKAIPSTFAYKFTIVNADESVSWESGDNKLITVTEDSEFEGVYLAQNAPEGNIPYFDNITPSDVFTEDTEVVFEVDLRAAYYHLADSASLPADVQTGTGADSTISWLYGNGPLLANGWEDWGVSESDAEAAGLVFNDSGENGDEVEGDSLYSATFSYVAGDARVGAFKMGVNGQDNEAGFGADHSVRINDANRIEVVFGAFVRADTVYDDLYDEYILATEEGPVVVRNGGSGDDGVIVSNEEEAIESPQEFELSQNYPNPFNPTTNINFTLPQATNVSLTVYNVLGQQVARLVNGRLAAGQHSVQFDASNLASGMYLYRIEAGTFTQNKKMMLIK